MEKDKQRVKELEAQVKTQKYRNFQEKVLLLKMLEKKIGSKVLTAFDEYIYESSKKHWRNIAEQKGSNTIADLLEVLWKPMENEFQFSIEKKENGIQIYCTHCPLAEMAKELGETEWGFKFYCMEDYGIVDGFNPKIGFKRTKTLMEGHVYCDHFYYMK